MHDINFLVVQSEWICVMLFCLCGERWIERAWGRIGGERGVVVVDFWMTFGVSVCVYTFVLVYACISWWYRAQLLVLSFTHWYSSIENVSGIFTKTSTSIPSRNNSLKTISCVCRLCKRHSNTQWMRKNRYTTLISLFTFFLVVFFSWWFYAFISSFWIKLLYFFIVFKGRHQMQLPNYHL